MKKILSSIVFLLLAVAFLFQLSAWLMPKAQNRYYMMDRHIAENVTDRDVQVFGACHAYSSFHTTVLKENTGLSTYVYANPGEIIPVTYVRMVEQFKKYTPKVAVLDIWGINAYETYDSTERILEFYTPPNVQALPYSKEKVELIADFDFLDPLEMHFPLSQYKARLLDGSLTELDFDYQPDNLEPFAEKHIASETALRQENDGFFPQTANAIAACRDPQNQIPADHFVEIEPVMVKYLEKIIALCRQYDVELILYRAPYLATANELGKLNHLRQICDENGVLFLDLEQEIDFSYDTDFYDAYHLSEHGAEKATLFLQDYILDAINK